MALRRRKLLILLAGALCVAGCGVRTPPLTRSEPAPVVARQEASPTAATSASASAPGPTSSYRHPVAGVALPDGFVPQRLGPGERPPQFVIVSFDGAGWADKWDFWLALGERVPFRFTAFLSGPYLLSSATRGAYDPPGYPPGTSELGWYDAADLPVEIRNLNRAVAAGVEVGTHFNGHFCASAGLPSGGNTWSAADWRAELGQFFHLLADYRANNPGQQLPRLSVRGGDVLGARTPCLEGDPATLYPVLSGRGLVYDSSFTREGLGWPTRDRASGIWRFGMQTFPMHGRLPDGRRGVPVTSMDYNYYFSQRGGSDSGVDLADSRRDSAQVLATYRDMYAAAFAGNRAPLVLGNHFNEWNHDAYSTALARFLVEVCGQPDTQCVPFRDVVAWLQVQSPAVRAGLQAAPPELSGP